MARTKALKQVDGKRAAIYARVSDKSQAEDDKTSLSEQTTEMEAYCEGKGMTVTARYQEVGRGWSKKRPEFQRMLADARNGRFDTIVCWKSDRLSRGMYPAAALMTASRRIWWASTTSMRAAAGYMPRLSRSDFQQTMVSNRPRLASSSIRWNSGRFLDQPLPTS